MKLSELKARGAVVPRELVEKTITWKHPDPETGKTVTDEFTVHVRRMSYGQVESIVKTMPSDDPERSYNAALISRALVLGDDPEKKPETLDYDTAYHLDPSLAYLFIAAINQVNRRGEHKKKRSRPPTNSGTSSSSTASAGEPSQKRKNA